MEILGYENQEKKKHTKEKIWKPYFKLIFKAKLPYLWIILVIIMGLLSTTLTLMFPAFTQKIMAGDISKAVIYGAVGVIIGKTLISAIVRFITGVTKYKIDKSFRILIWKKLIHSPVELFDKVKASEMVSRTTSDTSKISDVLSWAIPDLFTLTYGSIGTIVILFSYDWRLGISQLIYIPIYLGIVIWYGRMQYKANKKVQDKLSTLTQFLSELLVNIPLIKTFVNEKKEEKRGKKYIEDYYKVGIKKGILDWSLTPIRSILEIIQNIIVIVLGVYLVSKNIITIDIWIAYFMYIGMLHGILGSYIMTYQIIKESQGATDRISKLIESPDEKYIKKHSLKDINNDIVFDNVSFKYGDKKVLKNINFTIPQGKVTALVGESGGGKTTIFSLLQQFYNIESGNIKLGEKNIYEFHLKAWRNSFSVVSQDTSLFSGTIYENIIYGSNKSVSKEEVINAAKSANALEFINSFKEGFETEVGEGGEKLSGGQRQRIAIARAFLKDSKYLLLDEATSNIDALSEEAIKLSLKKLTKGKTTLIITHDLGSIIDADQIILLDSGKINGIGSHSELFKTNKLYQLFVNIKKESTEKDFIFN